MSENNTVDICCGTCIFSAKNERMLGALNCTALPPTPVASPQGISMVLPMVDAHYKCRYYHPNGLMFKVLTAPDHSQELPA